MEQVAQNPGSCVSADLGTNGKSGLHLAGCSKYPRITRKVLSSAGLTLQDITYRLHLGNELHDMGTAAEIMEAACESIGRTGAKLCEGCDLFVPKGSPDSLQTTTVEDISQYPSGPEYTPGPDTALIGVPATETAVLLYLAGS